MLCFLSFLPFSMTIYLPYHDKFWCTVLLVVLASFGTIFVAFTTDIRSGRDIYSSYGCRIGMLPVRVILFNELWCGSLHLSSTLWITTVASAGIMWRLWYIVATQSTMSTMTPWLSWRGETNGDRFTLYLCRGHQRNRTLINNDPLNVASIKTTSSSFQLPMIDNRVDLARRWDS